MTIQEFFTKYNGKFVDFDKRYGNTCVDLYRQYCQEVLQFPQSPPVSGAADIWNTYKQDLFQRIPNTFWAIPRLGDIIIWNKQINGYGHVAIYQSGNLWNFISFDQNWPVGSPCHLQKHSYRYIIGWLRPKITVSALVLPKIPLQIARIGLNLPLGSEFQRQVAYYGSNKISCVINDYNAEVKKDVGMFTQDEAYALADKLNIQERFIFIFYKPNPTSAYYATYYYPKRNCCITTCMGTDARSLAYEFAHQLQYFYNENRGSGSPVQVVDFWPPTDELIKSKYDSISQFYN